MDLQITIKIYRLYKSENNKIYNVSIKNLNLIILVKNIE